MLPGSALGAVAGKAVRTGKLTPDDLGFGDEPSSEWDNLSQDELVRLWPQYLQSVGVLPSLPDPSDIEEFSASVKWFFGGWPEQFDRENGGHVVRWLWGDPSAPANTPYSALYLQRRHVAALYTRAVGQAVTALPAGSLPGYEYSIMPVNWWPATPGQGSGAQDHRQLFLLDPYVQDDLGDTNIVLAADDLQLGLSWYEIAVWGWGTKDIARKQALAQIQDEISAEAHAQQDAHTLGEIANFVTSAIKIVTSAIALNPVGVANGLRSLMSEAEREITQDDSLASLMADLAGPYPAPLIDQSPYVEWADWCSRHDPSVLGVVARTFRASSRFDIWARTHWSALKSINYQGAFW